MTALLWRLVNRACAWMERLIPPADFRDIDGPDELSEVEARSEVSEPWWPREVVALEEWLRDLDRQLAPLYGGEQQ